MWPGAKPDAPGSELVLCCPDPLFVAPLSSDVDDVLISWPGAKPDAPGLDEVVLCWPGALPDAPGLDEAVLCWPGALPDAPGELPEFPCPPE